MQQKTKIEFTKQCIMKAARTSIRLKHALAGDAEITLAMTKTERADVRLKHTLAADEEINEKLPELERKIDEALQAGVGISMNPAKYLEG